MEDGFVKANNENLPKVDAFMIGMFFSNNSDLCSAEFRNAKMSISSRQSYGDDAVGYVQLKRTSTLCTVKAKICPEHKVRQKQYCVTMIVDEKKGEVCSVKCNDCPASEGCCKHSIAFLMWTHRSEEPARTDIECYWKKSKLAKVGTTLKFITLKNMSSQSKIRKNMDTVKNNHDVFQKFVEEGIKRKLRNCQILKHQPTYEIDPILVLSMHYLSSKFNTENDAGKFMSNIQSVVTQSNLIHVEIETRQQHNSPAWHELRYARITASRAYEVSRCHTSDGSLIALLMGAKVPDTPTLDRGRKLESLVKKQVGKQYSAISECGLYISPQYPILAASPDGILNADTVIEIKCPVNEKTFKNYIVEGKVRDRYYAQVQMQMYVTNLKKSLLCVASWDFEKNNEVSIIPLSFNPEYANELVNKLIIFGRQMYTPYYIKVPNKTLK